MRDVLMLAGRNLLRYRRRTLLTALLIVLGVVAVLVFVAVAGSFKAMMVGQITDAMIGHLQVHRHGYVQSIDSLPLNANLTPQAMEKLTAELDRLGTVAAWSPRVKFGAMFSNFAETTNIRLNGVDPEREALTAPLLPKRVSDGSVAGGLVERGKILIPDLIAKGMKVAVGDPVVLVATNADGSVNGKTFTVQGVLEGVAGPGGRDGYLHIDDARDLLRLKQPEVSEVAVRVKGLDQVPATVAALQAALDGVTNPQGRPVFEVHPWDTLSPFGSIARMIDLLNLFIRVLLVAIVLISVMNVMMMAVFERVREIGTLAAIGTRPRTILALFLSEGALLGLVGTVAGIAASLAVVAGLRAAKVTFSFGRQDNLVLEPSLAVGPIVVVGVIVVAVAVLASLQPAWKAARLNPIDALRHV